MTEAGLSGLGVEDESENVGPIVKKALFGDFGGDKADYTLGKLAGARHYTMLAGARHYTMCAYCFLLYYCSQGRLTMPHIHALIYNNDRHSIRCEEDLSTA